MPSRKTAQNTQKHTISISSTTHGRSIKSDDSAQKAEILYTQSDADNEQRVTPEAKAKAKARCVRTVRVKHFVDEAHFGRLLRILLWEC